MTQQRPAASAGDRRRSFMQHRLATRAIPLIMTMAGIVSLTGIGASMTGCMPTPGEGGGGERAKDAQGGQQGGGKDAGTTTDAPVSPPSDANTGGKDSNPSTEPDTRVMVDAPSPADTSSADTAAGDGGIADVGGSV